MPNPDGSPTQAEIADFLSPIRADGSKGNPGDAGRAVEALTNYTGDRPYDSQGPMYDQRTNSLSPAGLAGVQGLQGRIAAGVGPSTNPVMQALQARLGANPSLGALLGLNLPAVAPTNPYLPTAAAPVDPRLSPAQSWWLSQGGGR